MFLLLGQKKKKSWFSSLCISSNQHRKSAEYYPKHPQLGWEKGWKILAPKELFFGEGRGKRGGTGGGGLRGCLQRPWEHILTFHPHCLSEAPNASCWKHRGSPGSRSSWQLTLNNIPSVTLHSPSPQLSWFLLPQVAHHQGLPHIRTLGDLNLFWVTNLLGKPTKTSPQEYTSVEF